MINSYDAKNYRRVAGLSGDRSPIASGVRRPRALYTATGGETSLDLSTLSPQISYNPGNGQLDIKSSVGSFIAGIDFYETSATTVSFATPLLPGEVLEITQTLLFTGNMVAQVIPNIYTVNGATAGLTGVTCDFSWPLNGLPSKRIGYANVKVDGKELQRNANNASSGGDADYYEVNLGQANTNQIVFTVPLVGGENVSVTNTFTPIDTSAASTLFNNQTLTNIQSEITEGFQPFVTSSNTIAVPSTTIVNRAQIPDLANNLKAHMGVERIVFQTGYQLQNEFGQNGESVWGIVNDIFGQIRFVGAGWNFTTDINGTKSASNTAGDYLEIVFYGTGINLLAFVNSGSRTWNYSVDGGTAVTGNYPTSGSDVLNSRNYAEYQILNVVSGLSQGTHTIKIIITSGNNLYFGLEILNESSTIKVNPGTSYINGNKLTNTAQAALAYNSSFDEGTLGTKGGRVTVYQKADGVTIAKTVTPVNASAAYIGSADHTNEEVARTYHVREFGAGRGSLAAPDDFSLLTGTNFDCAFTLDDGVTTLTSTQGKLVPIAGSDALVANANGAFWVFTFVGSGIDIICGFDAATVDSMQISVDGTLQTTITTAPFATGIYRTYKVASGLPYGTHTVTVSRNAYVNGVLYARAFVVYQPKKLGLLAGEVEIADYNVMATYVANATAGQNTIATGVLRKHATREMVYVNGTGGTTDWIASLSATAVGSYAVASDRLNSYFQYTFFGTGFELRFTATSTRSTNISVTLNGLAATTANFATLTSSVYGTGVTFAAGVLDQADAATQPGCGLSISSLPLGTYTVKFNNNTASAFLVVNCLDIITPVHSHRSNIAVDYQNALPVGSCSLSDNRNFTPVKAALSTKKNWVQATGVTSAPTTTSATLVPCPDLSVLIKTNGGDLKLSFFLIFSHSVATTACYFQIYLDGVAVGSSKTIHSSPTATAYSEASDSFKIAASPGHHKVDLYWGTGAATMTGIGSRNLTAEET